MDRVKIELEQNSDAWKEWRRNVLGASDVPKVLGLVDRVGSQPWNIWEEKVYGIEKENSFILEKGHEIEAKVRADFELTNGNCPPACFQRDFLGASLDGWNGKDGIEIKYVGKEHVDTCPPHHFAQIQTQLWVSGAEKIIYLPCDGERIGKNPDGSPFVFTLDKAWWKENVTTLRRFWRDVEKKKEETKGLNQ